MYIYTHRKRQRERESLYSCLHMYAYKYRLCIYVCIHIYIICIYTCMHMHIYIVCRHTYMYIYMCVYVHKTMNLCIHVIPLIMLRALLWNVLTRYVVVMGGGVITQPKVPEGSTQLCIIATVVSY